MSRIPNISLRLHGGISAAECIELARAAGTAEFAGIWFAENAFARGTLPAAATCAMATQRIAINAGVFNPFSRHPTMMAMEIGALDELSGGRATLSIGLGIASATEKLGMDPSKPVPGLRDTLTIVRSLLRSGEFQTIRVRRSPRARSSSITRRARTSRFISRVAAISRPSSLVNSPTELLRLQHGFSLVCGTLG